ncbi:MAG: hypothetical protein COZ74_01425 [Flavobacteriaceae bacterium CG_4_8_14_3_um_filter_31_8]|nr:MAG: hypothetical protein COW43_00390 [Flavobacteriaceae bacterium CG17_big_fil_post_rev_8_21_14_2_50_31_13]PIX15013.1 MAG: hypothetical protein COZ74_01425 [Flavobacteriaceae bacterium CG_4_8_14_3_um_filter_31_8]
MTKFYLKTYCPKSATSEPHFFILSKGKNSGKPLTEPCPNCFVLSAKTEEEKQLLYALSFGLWKAKSFEYFLKGSVILFITIGDCRQALNDGLEQANSNPNGFKKSVKALELLEEQEKRFLQNLQLINEAKRVIFHRYIRRR